MVVGCNYQWHVLNIDRGHELIKHLLGESGIINFCVHLKSVACFIGKHCCVGTLDM